MAVPGTVRNYCDARVLLYGCSTHLRCSPEKPGIQHPDRRLQPVAGGCSLHRELPVPGTTLAGGDPAARYYLDFGDGQAPYFGFNDFVSHTYDYPGTYLLKYRAGTACDRWIEGNTTLVVATPPNYTPVLHGCPIIQPQAAFSGIPLSGIAPLTVQFTSTSTGASDYSWDFGDGTTSPAQNPRHTYLTAGLYSVTLIARDICTGTESTATMSHFVTVTVPSGTLAVTTVPGGAGVFIDNAFKGVTPLTLQDTASGYHVLLITAGRVRGLYHHHNGRTLENRTYPRGAPENVREPDNRHHRHNSHNPPATAERIDCHNLGPERRLGDVRRHLRGDNTGDRYRMSCPVTMTSN